MCMRELVVQALEDAGAGFGARPDRSGDNKSSARSRVGGRSVSDAFRGSSGGKDKTSLQRKAAPVQRGDLLQLRSGLRALPEQHVAALFVPKPGVVCGSRGGCRGPWYPRRSGGIVSRSAAQRLGVGSLRGGRCTLDRYRFKKNGGHRDGRRRSVGAQEVPARRVTWGAAFQASPTRER